MIRVIVADDSPTSLALLAEILRSDPEIEVVGLAKDGLEAVQMTQTLRPNVVVMDVHMPRLDGLAATKEIMITAPTPIVIVTASTESPHVDGAMQALRAGALAGLRKPLGPNSADFVKDAEKFLWTVKAMAAVKVVRHWRRDSQRGSQIRPQTNSHTSPLVAVAASTGGPAAISRLFVGLRADFPAPILIVQHIGAGFIRGFADWLGNCALVRVKLAEPGERLACGTAYVAPEDQHLGVTRGGAVLLADDPPIGGFRPSASFLFESVARACGNSAVAVILTGMGEDGLAGLHAIVRAGGKVIAQDERSSVVFGMPGAAVQAGLATLILPIEDIASHLESVVAGLVAD